MTDLISRQALYEKTTDLEARALDYVGKLIERDGDEPSEEWKVWTAILNERTAFKHDVMDAPTVDIVRCGECVNWDGEKHWCNIRDSYGWDYKPDDFCSYGEREVNRNDYLRIPWNRKINNG